MTSGPPMSPALPLANPLDRVARLACGALGVPGAFAALQHGEGGMRLGKAGDAAGEGRGRSALEAVARELIAAGRAKSVDGAWAGVPIVDAAGRPVGALAALDGAQRRWTPADLELLTDLAALVAAGLPAAESGTVAEEGTLLAVLGVEQQWVRRLLQSDMIGIQIAEDEVIVQANDSFLRTVGYSREDLASGRLRWREMTAPEYAEADERAREELTRQGSFRPYEKEYLRKDGTRVPVLLVGSLVRAEPLCRVSFVVDLTERKRLERRVRQAQRIESVVQLAGGVAHDFNNLLTAIIGSAELLLDDGGLADEPRADLEEILKAANRAAQLTQQLLAFSRKQVLKPVVVDLNTVVDDLARLLRRLAGESVELVTELAPSVEPIVADRGQLEQAIADLVLRARDAMPQGGRTVLATANHKVDAEFAESRPDLRPGRYVVLSARDSGPVVDRAALESIFEPFAPPSGRGEAGMGLASLYGVVKQSGGYAEVQADAAGGALFTIYLPAVTRPSREIAAMDDGEKVRASETILLVEDEDQVRALTQRLLERAGYTVVSAADAQSAMALANRHPGSIHLLLVDMMLPDQSGRELAAQITIHRPAVKVLYISGTTDDAIDRHRALSPGIEFLQKPFAREQLVRKVRKVLDAPLARS
jgi:two-component system, cell cycle sensor histidine kinase and response regulator CckA